MANIRSKLQQQPAWIALAITLALILWIASGMVSGQTDSLEKASDDKPSLQKVQVTTMLADQVDTEISLYGRTEPDRTATLRAEVKGQVKQILVQEGQAVSEGQHLVLLDQNDLPARIAAARATLKQRIIEQDGAKSLSQRGLQSEATQALADANVANAEAQLASLELALENTVIKAPFAGVMDQHFMEVGDYLREGDRIASVVDLDPLVVRADVTEADVAALSVGQKATGRLASGQYLEGAIRYIASVSDEGTNTFEIEVAVPNAESNILAGISTELTLPLAQTYAMRVTPAIMALDERGELGVKIVEDNIVRFIPIDMVKSDSQGVWLSGLGEQADVITLGQGFVRDGDEVEVVYSQSVAQVQ